MEWIWLTALALVAGVLSVVTEGHVVAGQVGQGTGTQEIAYEEYLLIVT